MLRHCNLQISHIRYYNDVTWGHGFKSLATRVFLKSLFRITTKKHQKSASRVLWIPLAHKAFSYHDVIVDTLRTCTWHITWRLLKWSVRDTYHCYIDTFVSLSFSTKQLADSEVPEKTDVSVLFNYCATFMTPPRQTNSRLTPNMSVFMRPYCLAKQYWVRQHDYIWCIALQGCKIYRKTSNISRTLVGNKIVDNSDVVGASPVGAAPTTSSFST